MRAVLVTRCQFSSCDIVIFWDFLNWFNFKLDGQLYLNWRGDGNAIVSAFKNENLDVEWDGSDDKCIIINF